MSTNNSSRSGSHIVQCSDPEGLFCQAFIVAGWAEFDLGFWAQQVGLQ